MLTEAGVELEEWSRQANLSARQQVRMSRRVSEMTSFAMMDNDVKSKRMRETTNRVMRDKTNFRERRPQTGDNEEI
jgi:hypothetical protein